MLQVGLSWIDYSQMNVFVWFWSQYLIAKNISFYFFNEKQNIIVIQQ